MGRWRHSDMPPEPMSLAELCLSNRNLPSMLPLFLTGSAHIDTRLAVPPSLLVIRPRCSWPMLPLHSTDDHADGNDRRHRPSGSTECWRGSAGVCRDIRSHLCGDRGVESMYVSSSSPRKRRSVSASGWFSLSAGTALLWCWSAASALDVCCDCDPSVSFCFNAFTLACKCRIWQPKDRKGHRPMFSNKERDGTA